MTMKEGRETVNKGRARLKEERERMRSRVRLQGGGGGGGGGQGGGKPRAKGAKTGILCGIFLSVLVFYF